jgi:enamine deaminase RidA (YjgF/YER057c/UK114 family)
MTRIIDTDAAPKAVGPYPQAVVVDGRPYSSGRIPLTPGGELVAGGLSVVLLPDREAAVLVARPRNLG